MTTKKVIGGAAAPVALYVMREDGQCEPFQFIQQEPATIVLPSPVLETKHYFISTHIKSDVRKNAPLDILFITGTLQDRLGWSISCGGDLDVVFYSSVRLNASGQRLGVSRTDLSSDILPESSVFHTPTIRDLGSEIFSEYSPGGSGNSANGTVSAFVEIRWTLKPNTIYLIRGINRSNQSKRMSAMLVWEELNE